MTLTSKGAKVLVNFRGTENVSMVFLDRGWRHQSHGLNPILVLPVRSSLANPRTSSSCCPDVGDAVSPD